MARATNPFWRTACTGTFRCAMLGLAMAGALGPAPVAARTVALLIGIGQFDNIGLVSPDQAKKLKLEGPPLDVAAMRRVVEQRMGARPDDIHVLLDHQASRANIRAELAALVSRSQPGDTVVIYFSGHGTSQRDTGSRTGLPQGTSAWIPADFDWGNVDNVGPRLISGRLDIRPLALEPLDRGGRTVIIISDSCFSGNIARGIGSPAGEVISRFAPLGDSADSPDGLPEAVKAADFTPAVYPYRRVLMLSASSDTEKAAELGGDRAQQTIDGKPKGALTDALLRVFEGVAPADYDRDGKVSFVELRRAVVEDMVEKRLAQSPQLLPSLDQDPAGIIFAPVPGVPALTAGGPADRLTVAVPDKAGPLVAALRGSGEFSLVAGDAAMVVQRGSGADRFSLITGTGDLVVKDVSADVIVARLRAASWARGVVAGAGARIALAADTEPTARGGNFLIGRDSLQFAVKAGAPVWYMVFDIDPAGRLITLWPTSPEEDRPAPAGAVQTFGKTRATEPAGLDHVVVLAFPQAPAGIAAWYGMNADFGGAEAGGLVQWLARQRGAYAAATIDVRTIRACPAKGGTPCEP